MLLQKVEDELAGSMVVGPVDSHFPEEVFRTGMTEQNPGNAVPEVVHGKKRLGARLGALVLRRHEGAAEFHGFGEIVADELR